MNDYSKSDTIIFQHVLSKSGCNEWLALTTPITLSYCLKYSIDYDLVARSILGYAGHWDVPHLITEYINKGYKNIIYLDADTVIVDTSIDLREACIRGKIGAVWHDLSYHDPDWSHFNVGALYIGADNSIRDFMSEWIQKAPGSPAFPWYEQGAFNVLGKQKNIINHLDNKWNAGHVSPSDKKVVWGLHGVPDRYEQMKAYVKSLEA